MSKLNRTEEASVLVLGTIVAFAIIYLFWAAAIGIVTWAFDLEFRWTYPIGFAIIFWILTLLFRR